MVIYIICLGFLENLCNSLVYMDNYSDILNTVDTEGRTWHFLSESLKYE